VCLDLESQLASIYFDKLGAHRHLLAFWGGSDMLDMHLAETVVCPSGK
jgi:hypothetical protein